jgi:SNF2 family DNA or RNA helicase
MKGTGDVKTINYNKVLIFANYEETLDKINIILIENEIKYWKLGGTHSSINNIVDEFTKYEGKCALIINSIRHCAGLNLQMCTDLVFAHKIFDANIETQVVGRGQRLGRLSTLRIHYMFYENEYDYMIQNNTIREI